VRFGDKDLSGAQRDRSKSEAEYAKAD